MRHLPVIGALVMVISMVSGCRQPSSMQHTPAAPLPTKAKIVFATTLSGGVNAQIYLMNADGTGLTRLTKDSGWDLEPAWSPDGKKIVFSSCSAFANCSTTRFGVVQRQIYVMNADGSAQTRLTGGGDNVSPAWSPDGRKIAFSRVEFASNQLSSHQEIYLMNPDGTSQSKLTTQSLDGTTDDTSPTWSPDSKRLAFGRVGLAEAAGKVRGQIYVMNADGRGVTLLTSDEGLNQAPSWSPDGEQIAFSSGAIGRTQIYVMNEDGTGRRQVTKDRGASPAWAPGGKISFVNGADFQLYLINVDGSGEIPLTNNGAENLSAAWWPIK